MRWSGWLLDNLGLKLFALLLAVLLYLHVLTDRVVEETVRFPLTVSSLPDSLALASSPPAWVEARLRGTGKQILRLRYLRPALDVSLAGATTGTFQRAFGPADVPLEGAGDVAVVEIVEPARLALEVAPRAERRVPVRATLSGSPLRGYVVAGEPEVKPASVRLSGPAPWVAAQESIASRPIDVAGAKETIEVLEALAPLPAFARTSPGSVLVAIRIEPEETRTLRVPIEVRGIRGELRAEPRPAAVEVTWRGPRSVAEGLEPASFRARVDAGRRGRGEFRLRVELDGPGLGGPRPTATATPESVQVVLH